MRILFCINTLGSGGKERRLTELLKELNNYAGISFELIILSKDIHYEDVLTLDIKVHRIIRRSKKDILLFRELYKVCQIFKPHIVHTWDSMSAVYFVPICGLLKISLINGMVVDVPERCNIFNKYWTRAKVTFPFSDFIVGNSAAGLNAYGAPEKKRVLIPNGFNFRRIDNLVPPLIVREQLQISEGYVVGMVASFSERKDYKSYYNAAKLLLQKRSDLTFLAVGSGTDSPQSRDLIDKKHSHSFRLLGKKTGVESLINVMDIGVLATFTEGISNSIMEFMALGKPVIATCGGGTNELIIDNVTGFLTSRSNPEELAEKIERLINNSFLRGKMGEAGMERIKEQFSIEKMVDRYRLLYVQSLTGQGIPLEE